MYLEMHSRFCQVTEMELFAKMLTNFEKDSIVNVRRGLEWTCECNSIKSYEKIVRKLS